MLTGDIRGSLCCSRLTVMFRGFCVIQVSLLFKVKAKIGTSSSDIHQLQFGKLHHFKLETYRSI